MSITSAIVLYAVIWFLTLFVVLPLGVVTQGEAGRVEPGTPEGAPEGAVMARKLRMTTVAATVLWLVVTAVILSGAISVRDFDVMNRLPPESGARGTGE
jgi:predicted secreted protein